MEGQKSETLGSRIILAGQLLNDANHELEVGKETELL